MSGYPYPPYPPSSEFPENDPTYGWIAPPFPQPTFPPQVLPEVASGQPEGFAQAAAIAAAQPEQLLNNKVAIPRSANSAAVSNRGRVSRACENCREQKVKCSGQRPTCQRCQDAEIQCSYGDRKREKLARRLSDLTARVDTLETLLQNIYPNLDSLSAQYVERIFSDQYDKDQPPSHLPSEIPSPLLTTDAGSSIGAIDLTKEDFNHDEKIQAMGFVGEHSEIAWIYRLKKLLHHLHQGRLDRDLARDYVTAANYFVDDSDVIILSNVDLSRRPLPTVADRLVESFFQVVHPCFPIVNKAIFMDQYKSFYSSPSVRPGTRWLAVLNLIFAIAMKLVHNSSKDDETTTDDHNVYFSRAWRLSMGDTSLLGHPNLQQVQVEGLITFYLMTVGQANRAWRLSGISIQSAITMGLNLRNESSAILFSWRENRYRIWWSIYVLHVLLCVMTGRLPSSTDDSCTTPLPVPFSEDEFSRGEIEQLIEDHDARTSFMRNLVSQFSAQSAESALVPDSARHQNPSHGQQSDQVASAALQFLTPNASLHFLYFVELGLIMRRTIDALYAPGAGRKSWHSMEMIISALNSRTDSWLDKLPAELHFTRGALACERERLSLAFAFYSTKILITQPCLSRTLLQATWDDKTEEFTTTTAAMCIDMASYMLQLLPDVPDLTWAYRLSPWWCSVHYIMQATTVLFTSLVIKERVNTVHHYRTFESISKASNWLSSLAEKDPSAHRALVAVQDLTSFRGIEAALEAQREN
ncbi:putative C6 transcription factor [Aspergillus stella-maris]|uniref:putative C6 transcription factor n=1 Tax=Aspergillus stella-maris TaxID=1810926 RepID=UPI003CCCFB06